jgi:hypothetical protein
MSDEPMFDALRTVFGRAAIASLDATETETTFWPSSLVEVALHESGHAVAFVHLGLRFFEVCANPTRPSAFERTLGHISHPEWARPSAVVHPTNYNLRLPLPELRARLAPSLGRPVGGLLLAERQALALLAGGAAERLVRKARGFPGSGRDRSFALAILGIECRSTEEARARLRRIDRRAAAFVRVNERAIRAVAYALSERRLLSSRSVGHILRWDLARPDQEHRRRDRDDRRQDHGHRHRAGDLDVARM